MHMMVPATGLHLLVQVVAVCCEGVIRHLQQLLLLVMVVVVAAGAVVGAQRRRVAPCHAARTMQVDAGGGGDGQQGVI
jgi:uncharacterized protein YybS (DUF2232 family)